MTIKAINSKKKPPAILAPEGLQIFIRTEPLSVSANHQFQLGAYFYMGIM